MLIKMHFFIWGKGVTKPLWNHIIILFFCNVFNKLHHKYYLKKNLKYIIRMEIIRSFKQAFHFGEFSKVSGTGVKWEVSYHLFNRF